MAGLVAVLSARGGVSCVIRLQINNINELWGTKST